MKILTVSIVSRTYKNSKLHYKKAVDSHKLSMQTPYDIVKNITILSKQVYRMEIMHFPSVTDHYSGLVEKTSVTAALVYPPAKHFGL